MSRRAIFVLLLLIALLLGSAELFARLIVQRHSKVEVMVTREHREALALRPAANGTPKQLLIVGNSFVGMDLDLPTLQQRLAPAWNVHRYWLYNTYYNDWYYGLKRLLAEGSRPDAIAVTFATTSFQISTIRGDYSSYYLFQPRDLLSLESAADLDNTETANLLFARYSRFYGLRSEIRKVLLQSVLHDLPRMYNLFHPPSGTPLKGATVSSAITPRLAALEQLTSRYGVRLLIIVPPLPRPGQEFQPEMRQAAARAGITVVMPYSSHDLPASLYIDDVHLSPEGALKFSETIAPLLADALGATPQPGVDASDFHRDHPQAPVVGIPAALAVQHRP
ncbi:MAG TPA: hypothetical protein VKX25_00765 [Bryobacteraceae bacterium]|jgi:hypothetical protein|nr:hypothetical protein [Bryobacteraceae bacterium]